MKQFRDVRAWQLVSKRDLLGMTPHRGHLLVWTGKCPFLHLTCRKCGTIWGDAVIWPDENCPV